MVTCLRCPGGKGHPRDGIDFAENGLAQYDASGSVHHGIETKVQQDCTTGGGRKSVSDDGLFLDLTAFKGFLLYPSTKSITAHHNCCDTVLDRLADVIQTDHYLL